MTCPFENNLQAYLDGELKKEDRKALMAHLEKCASCRDQLAELDLLEKWSDTALSQVLFPAESTDSPDTADTEQAWVRFSQKINGMDSKTNNADSVVTPIESPYPTRERSLIIYMKKYRKLMTGIAAAVILAAFLMIPQVKTFAGEVLALFRVDQIQMVNITPDDIRQMQNFFESGEKAQITIDDIGKMTIDEGDFSQKVYASGSEAETAGINLPPSPVAYTVDAVTVQSAAKVSMALNTDTINAAMKKLGSDVAFDSSLNGKTFTVIWPGITNITFKNSESQDFKTLYYTVMDSPEILAPSLADAKTLKTTLLQVPFIPENIRSQLAGIDDWQNTLPFPVIQGSMDIDRTEKVMVNGGDGVFMMAKDRSAILLWENNGKLYSIQVNANAELDDDSVKSGLLRLADNF